MEETLTMAPPPDSIMAGMAYLLARIMLVRLTDMTLSHSAWLTSVTRPGAVDAHVVVEDMESAVSIEGGLHHGAAFFLSGNVGDEDAGLAAFLLDGFEGLGGAFFDVVDQQHLCALAGEEDADGLAVAHDVAAGAGSGDDGHLVL